MMLILLGAPGAGKGSVAAHLVNAFKIPHISTGDILRDHISRDTDLGRRVKSYTQAGQLVPDEVILALVEDRLKQADCARGFLFDGFPRTLAQAEGLSRLLSDHQLSLTKVVNLVVGNDIIIQRLVNRRVCSQCKAIYNLVNKPPRQEALCDVCHSPLEHRADDRLEVIQNRLSVYEIQTKPLIEYYTQLQLVFSIDATASPEENFKIIQEEIVGK